MNLRRWRKNQSQLDLQNPIEGERDESQFEQRSDERPEVDGATMGWMTQITTGWTVQMTTGWTDR